MVGHQNVGYVEAVLEQPNEVKEPLLVADLLLIVDVMSVHKKERVMEDFETERGNDDDVEQINQEFSVARPAHVHDRVMYGYE